jgi:DNA-directed RNA polymerase specialized sigma24 family protein
MGTVVSNEVSRFFRKQGRAFANADVDELARVEGRGEATSWEDDFTAHVLQEAINRTRPHFEPETWRAFELVWFEHRPAAQVAETLGHPIDWVYGAKSRVLKQLWEVVQELAEDSPILEGV